VHWGISALVKTFVSPQTSLGDLDAGSAASLIAAASDVTLIVDAEGVIRDTAFQSAELMGDLDDSADWVGRAIDTTVALDSRAKIAAMRREATTTAEPKWRHINHLTTDGRSVPVLYCGVQVGGDGRVVMFGRDLRIMSALQQRLMNAQQSMERDYSKLRDVEMRYRLLFQLSSEAVLILDPAKQRVLEANPTSSAIRCRRFSAPTACRRYRATWPQSAAAPGPRMCRPDWRVATSRCWSRRRCSARTMRRRS